jgi:hypothetical protein
MDRIHLIRNERNSIVKKVVIVNFRVSLRYICSIVFVLFTLLSITCSAWDYKGIETHEGFCVDDIHIRGGLKVVETFYEYLFSDTDIKHCPNIFVTSGAFLVLGRDIFRSTETYHVWTFLRENKSLFEFAPEDSHRTHFDEARKRYSLALSRRRDFVDGKLLDPVDVAGGLEIILRQFIDFDSGIEKRIAFPIYFCNKRRDYRIAYDSILINGIQLDWSVTRFHQRWRAKPLERDFDWIEALGFTDELRGKK